MDKEVSLTADNRFQYRLSRKSQDFGGLLVRAEYNTILTLEGLIGGRLFGSGYIGQVLHIRHDKGEALTVLYGLMYCIHKSFIQHRRDSDQVLGVFWTNNTF